MKKAVKNWKKRQLACGKQATPDSRLYLQPTAPTRKRKIFKITPRSKRFHLTSKIIVTGILFKKREAILFSERHVVMAYMLNYMLYRYN